MKIILSLAFMIFASPMALAICIGDLGGLSLDQVLNDLASIMAYAEELNPGASESVATQKIISEKLASLKTLLEEAHYDQAAISAVNQALKDKIVQLKTKEKVNSQTKAEVEAKARRGESFIVDFVPDISPFSRNMAGRTLEGKPESIGWSKDGRYLITFGRDNFFIYDLSNNYQKVKEVWLEEKSDLANSSIFEFDVQKRGIIARGVHDYWISLTDLLKDPKPIYHIEKETSHFLEGGHSSYIHDVFPNSNNFLAKLHPDEATGQTTTKLVKVALHNPTQEIVNYVGPEESSIRHVSDARISPDGKYIYARTRYQVLLFDGVSGQYLRTFETKQTKGEMIFDFQLSPDGKTLIHSTEYGVDFWSFPEGEPKHFIVENHADIKDLIWSPNSLLVAAEVNETGTKNGRCIHIWSALTGELLQEITLDKNPDGFVVDNGIWGLSFTTDNQGLVLVMGDGSLRIYKRRI